MELSSSSTFRTLNAFHFYYVIHLLKVQFFSCWKINKTNTKASKKRASGRLLWAFYHIDMPKKKQHDIIEILDRYFSSFRMIHQLFPIKIQLLDTHHL